MNISEIIDNINELADEQESTNVIIGFINDAIARVNIECDALFPSYSIEDTEEKFILPDKWTRTLIIPFGVGRVKQRDSSQFEYTDAYREFLENLDMFKVKYTIPEELKDPDSNEGTYPSDIYEHPPLPWFRF